MKITEFLRVEDIIPSLSASSKAAVLEELAAFTAEGHAGIDRAELLRVLNEREGLGSTGIGDGIAIPHGKLKGVERLLVVFGRSREGIYFDSLDGKPAHLFFLLVAPDEAAGQHLRVLACMSRLLKEPEARRKLLEAPDSAALYTIIREQDSCH